MTARAVPPSAALAELAALLGDRLSQSPAHLETHAHDESWHPAEAPDAVAFVESTEECAAVVSVCSRHGLPMVPFGAGTAVEGHIQAVQGGLSVDLSRMNRILAVESEDLDVHLQAGVDRVQLNRQLEKHGLTFPIDPGAEATLGGMAATGASGTTAVRYGTMRENVLGLTVVLADGRVIQTGGRARKSSAGYDLTRLFIGSEGTLGIITELRLRVQPLPESVAAAACPFPSLDEAVSAVVELLQTGVPVARCELMDERSVEAVNRYSQLGAPEKPTVFFEFHGAPKSVEEQSEIARGIAADHGGGEFRWSTRREDREEIWEARHKAYYAARALRPGSKGWPTDVAVPISRLAECIRETRRDCVAAGIDAPTLGHIGDGNFHTVFLFDSDNADELARVKAANQRLLDRALAMGGTITGEHGIGSGKIAALETQCGPAVDVMRSLKNALDPQGLMNPGKIFR